MKNIVISLVNYMDKQDSSLILEKINVKNRITLNSACIELLEWLRLEYKRELWIQEGRKASLKPLQLSPQYDWCTLLTEMVAQEPLFSYYLVIDNNRLSFGPNISEMTRSELRKLATELYKPLITSLKKFD